MKKTNLIIGCGIAGATIANRIAEKLHEDVLIVDKKDHIAGSCYDYKDKNGIFIHKYGAHILHTNKKDVWDFLSNFTKWNPYFHKVNCMIDGRMVNIPFNLSSLKKIFPDFLADEYSKILLKKYRYGDKVSILELKKSKDAKLGFLANFIYEKIFVNYTQKQWGIPLCELDPSVLSRIPINICTDDRYFGDKYQGIPLNGYSSMLRKMLDNKRIRINLSTSHKDCGDMKKYKRVFFSGRIDEFFEYKYGELPYRSLNFDTQILDIEFFQNTSVVNYPNNYDFTRIIEHKHFLNVKSSKTAISYEYPEAFVDGKNEPYYPVTNKESLKKYSLYMHDAEKLKNFHFIGRLGGFKYLNMDEVVDESLRIFEKISG